MYRTFLVLIAFVVAGMVQAQDKFTRKSGLWDMKVTSTRTGDERAHTYQMCVDQASDNAFLQVAGGLRSERCQTTKSARDGDKIVVDATCKVAMSTTATTHAIVTGKLDSVYKIESKSTFDPPLKGKSEGSSVIEAKWTGACKTGQRPGDVMFSDGTKVNLLAGDQPADHKAAEDKAAGGPKERSQRKHKGSGGYTPAPNPTK
jgi:Protein of unknown function (DUF3617)